MLLLIHNASKWQREKSSWEKGFIYSILLNFQFYLTKGYSISSTTLIFQRPIMIWFCICIVSLLTVYLCIIHSITCENASQSLYSCQDFSIANSLYIFLFKFPIVSTSPSSSSLLILCTYLCYGFAFTIHCSHGAELIYLVRKFVDDNQQLYSRRFISIVWKEGKKKKEFTLYN